MIVGYLECQWTVSMSMAESIILVDHYLLTLHVLDSGVYAAEILSWFGFIPTKYDYLHQDQIDWFFARVRYEMSCLFCSVF